MVKTGRVTMRDVAERAGVSTAAVSYAYSKPGRLTPQVLERIRECAAQLGYVRNSTARALSTGRTDTLGLVLPQSVDDAFENAYYPRFVQGVGRVCRDNGLMMLLVPPADGLAGLGVSEAPADGFIVIGLDSEHEEVAALLTRRAPFVLVDSDPVPGVPLVTVDDRGAMRDLVGRLLALGHRTFGVVAIETGRASHREWSGPMRHRLDGVEDAIATAGLQIDSDAVTVVEVPSSQTGGAAAFDSLWAAASPPTAIIAFSDEIALGILRAAAARGVDVPADVSVTGFDDLPGAALVSPGLTTVRQPIAEKAVVAARRLVELIQAARPAVAGMDASTDADNDNDAQGTEPVEGSGGAVNPGTGRTKPADAAVAFADRDHVVLPADVVERGSVAAPAR